MDVKICNYFTRNKVLLSYPKDDLIQSTFSKIHF